MVKKRKRPTTKTIHTSMVKRLAKLTGLFEYQVRTVIITFIKLAITDLCDGKDVYVMSLGKFWLRRTKPGKVWNPALQKMVDSGVRYIPKFSYGPTVARYIKKEAAKYFAAKDDRNNS